MKTRKKGFFWAILVLLSSCFAITAHAESACATPCNSCAPCGNVVTDAPLPGVDTAGVNPYLNYVATTDGRGGCYCPRDYFSGFYLGTGFGIGWINYHLQVSGVTPPFVEDKSRSYLLGVVNGGFGWAFNHFYIGAEVGYNYRSRTNPVSYEDTVAVLTTEADNFLGIPIATSRPGRIKVDINSQHATSIDFTPGFVYSRFLGYLRLGADQTKYDLTRRFCFPIVDFDLNLTDPLEATAVGTVDNAEFVFSQTKSSGSDYRVGLGFAVALNYCLSFRFDFIHTFGQKVTFTPDVPDSADLALILPTIEGVSDPLVTDVESGNLLTDITLKPQRNEIILGVRFKFFSF
jgi:hypothetical protein